MSEQALDFPVKVPRLSFQFPGFLLLSLGLHLFGFYLFQVVYRDPVNVAPQPAFLTLLRHGNPEDDTILNWIQAEDPARGARPPTVDPPGLLEVPYVPSYDSASVQPALPETTPSVPALPPGRTFDQLTAADLEPVARPPEPLPAPGTRLVAGPRLEPRLAALPSLPVADRPSALEPSRFLAGVTGEGRVAYVFLQGSSGDSATDERALQHLRGLAFDSDRAHPLTWSPVAYYWGGTP